MTNAPTIVWGHVPTRAGAGSWFALTIAGQLNAGAYGGTSVVNAITTPGFTQLAAKLLDAASLSDARRQAMYDKLNFVAPIAPLLKRGFAAHGRVRPPRDFVTWPEVILYSERRASPQTLVGFAMPLIEKAHPLTVLATPKHRKRVFGAVDQSDIFRVAATIADQLALLHGQTGDSGLLFTDLAPRNILITETLDVVFIDADSYQYSIGNRVFACQESTPGFRAPRIAKAAIAGHALPQFVPGDDAYVLAIILFYLLVDTAHPWRAGSAFEINGRSPEDEDNMLARRFPYADPDTLQPPRIRLATYQKLPAPLRDGFEQVFVANKLLSPTEWAKRLFEARQSSAPSKFIATASAGLSAAYP